MALSWANMMRVADYKCTTNSERRTYNFIWELHDMKNIRGSVTSSSFPISCEEVVKWNIKLNPMGLGETTPATLCLLDSRQEQLMTHFTISILNSSGNKSKISSTIQGHLRRQESLTTNLIKWDMLFSDSSNLISDGKLILFIEIAVEGLMNTTIETCSKIRISNTGLELSEDFAKLLDFGEHADITLETNGTEISAHKGILSARSPVFRAMLEHEMEEKKSSRVKVPDIKAAVLTDLLGFIYTGKIDSGKLSEELLIAADKYDMQQLKSMCEEALCVKLTVKTAVKTLIFADMHNAEELKAVTLKFINFHIVDVAKTGEWRELTIDRPNLVVDVFQFSIDRKTKSS